MSGKESVVYRMLLDARERQADLKKAVTLLTAMRDDFNRQVMEMDQIVEELERAHATLEQHTKTVNESPSFNNFIEELESKLRKPKG